MRMQCDNDNAPDLRHAAYLWYIRRSLSGLHDAVNFEMVMTAVAMMTV